MPRYFFNVIDGVSIPDNTGTELPDLYAARLAAVAYSGELLRDHPDAFWVQSEWRIEVKSESGLVLFAIHISAVEAPALHNWKPTGKQAAQSEAIKHITPTLIDSTPSA
jgi:hypothetical protein